MNKDWILTAERSDVCDSRPIITYTQTHESDQEMFEKCKKFVEALETRDEWPEAYDVILEIFDEFIPRKFVLYDDWIHISGGLWFYVKDYLLVRGRLHRAYRRFKIREHSAEPGRVGGCPNDADVWVVGTPEDLERFKGWLREVKFEGSMIEGKEIE